MVGMIHMLSPENSEASCCWRTRGCLNNNTPCNSSLTGHSEQEKLLFKQLNYKHFGDKNDKIHRYNEYLLQ